MNQLESACRSFLIVHGSCTTDKVAELMKLSLREAREVLWGLRRSGEVVRTTLVIRGQAKYVWGVPAQGDGAKLED